MSLHSSMSFKSQQKRIDRDQSATGVQLDADAEKRVEDQTAMFIEEMRAEKLAASMPDLAGMFQAVNDMTAEEKEDLENTIIMLEGLGR